MLSFTATPFRSQTRFFFPQKPHGTSNCRKLTVVRSSSGVTEELDKTTSLPGELGTKQKESLGFPDLKAAKRVVLVRHGQSSWNAEGRIQGSSDFAVLTQKGEAQAETSRQMLIDDSFDVCFSRSFSKFLFIILEIRKCVLIVMVL